MTNTESVLYKIVVFLISAFVVGVMIANLVYYNRIREGKTVTTSEATTMLWVSVILLVIGVLVFLWSIWRLLFTSEAREKQMQYIVGPYGGQMGFSYAPGMGPTAVVSSPTVAGVVTTPALTTDIESAQEYL